jgi:hypothetical protein
MQFKTHLGSIALEKECINSMECGFSSEFKSTGLCDSFEFKIPLY